MASVRLRTGITRAIGSKLANTTITSRIAVVKEELSLCPTGRIELPVDDLWYKLTLLNTMAGVLIVNGGV